MAEQKLHRVIMLLQMFIKLRNHQSNQFPQILQVFIDVIVGWRANKDVTLHETDKAPESFRFVLQFTKDGGQEITHALSVAGTKKRWEN